MVMRILAAVGALACYIALVCTDLDSTQRWLLVAVIWFQVIADWDRK